MQKPSFGVVAGVVTVLTAVAFLSRLVVDLIPAGPENRLASESAEFLLQAAHEQIDWRPLNEETFAEARKKDKPIMLIVGSACSPTGRAEDKLVFPAKEVRGFLARNFICARVDSMERPEFQNAFLPLSRAALQSDVRLAIPPDYQLWFLDPRGFLFGYAAESVQGQALDSKALLAHLEDAADRFEKLQDNKRFGANLDADLGIGAVHRFQLLKQLSGGRGAGEAPGLAQLADLAAIEVSAGASLPDFTQFAQYLEDSCHRDVGGFPVNGYQRLWPSAWQFQLIAGRYPDYLRSLGPCLASPEVDLLDGGFFTDSATLDWRGIDYDKLAVTNSAMMQTLAEGSILMGDPLQRWVAIRTCDALLNDFVDEGLLMAGQIGDSGPLGRSPHASFSPQRLRQLFPDDADREWLRTNLGLRVETNVQMTPMLTDLGGYVKDPTKFDSVFEILRKDRKKPKYAGVGQLDVGGFSAARMMHVARVLGDNVRLLKAEGLFERLDDLRILNDVSHSGAPGGVAHAYLGDYLAYADGALQYFLATGDLNALQNGVAVLRRGLFLYSTKVPGEYCLSQPAKTPLAPRDYSAPEIVDNVRESCSAQIIRLGNDYGRLLGAAGTDLTKVAVDTRARFAPFAQSLGQFGAGYFCACSRLIDPYVIAVGPDAIGKANLLAQRAPMNLVAPSVGPVRAPGSSPGFYVLSDGVPKGPLSLEQAASALKRQGF